jgi:hypothetical protein
MVSKIAFIKHSDGTLEDGDLYQGHMAVIKGSGFVNSRSSRDLSKISESLVRDSLDRRRSEGVLCVSCYNRL